VPLDATLTTTELRRLRDLCATGDRIDLLEAALILSTLQRDETIDTAPLRQHVAAIAAALADLVHRRGALPERLGEVIAATYGYRGDSETYDDLQNADVARVLERRKGLPVALAILYLHISRGQGWDAEGLAFPGHFLIRVTIDGARHVLDPFNDGQAVEPPELRTLLQRVLGPNAVLSPEHFDAVPDRDVLLRLENNVRLRLAKREDWPGSAHSLDRMLAIAPDRPELLFEAGQINARLDKRRAAIAAFERFLATPAAKADPAWSTQASQLLQELRRGLN
jgi:regulator of sirC expression with transglutaminase-like and TPR domain